MLGNNDGPFYEAEQKMQKDMMSASGATIEETYIRKMIAHYKGAIALSEVLLEQSSDSQVRQLAEETLGIQVEEIIDLEDLLSQQQAAK